MLIRKFNQLMCHCQIKLLFKEKGDFGPAPIGYPNHKVHTDDTQKDSRQGVDANFIEA